MSEQIGSNTAIKMTVKGNCGQIHTFEEWQKCNLCKVGPIEKMTDLGMLIEKNTWNAAIEAAAKAAYDEGDYNPAGYYVDAIRKLKK